ncbi:MAG: hypothetical protein ABL882_01500 [Sphingopyxis sp.]
MIALIETMFPAACLGLTVLIGGRPERAGAWIAIFGFVATSLIGVTTWHAFEGRVFVIDVAVLVGFWTIAIKSNRFWPYWVTAWQLVGVFVHMQSLIFVDTYARPYGMLSIYLSIPIVGLIGWSAVHYKIRKHIAA